MTVKFIYFEGCPNAEATRYLLKSLGIRFDEIRQDQLPSSDPYRSYTSPTILDGEKVIWGSRTGGAGGCSLGSPTRRDLLKNLDIQAKGRGKKWLLVMSSIISSMTVGLCPLCIPAIGSFLTAVGLGFLVNEAVLKPLLIALLILTVGGLLWSYQKHRHLGPSVLGFAFAVGLYLSRYVYFGGLLNDVLMYVSIVGLVGATVWNLFLKRQGQCC